MPTTATPSPQLDLLLRDAPAYQQAFARYEVLRPISQGQRTLGQQSQATGLPSHRLWPDRQRFQRTGLVGLLDHRTLPYARGKIPIEARVPLPVQHLTQAWGPAHLLMRLRTSRAYPTEEQARWRIIERLEVGFRPRRVAAWLAIAPHVVYDWQQRFQVLGFPGLTTRTREATPLTTRIPVHVMMEVFQLLDNHPL